MASERSVRILSEEIVGENLATALLQPLQFGVDMANIPYLVGKVLHLLGQYAGTQIYHQLAYLLHYVNYTNTYNVRVHVAHVC